MAIPNRLTWLRRKSSASRFGPNDWLTIIVASAVLVVFVVPAWRAAIIDASSWAHWPFALIVFAVALLVIAVPRGDVLGSKYLPVLIVALAVPVLVIRLMPSLASHVRTAEAAFFFGTIVAISEIASRYRDEPIQACLSPYGIVYIIFNGAISLGALVLILHCRTAFRTVADDSILAAVTAGFGAGAVMRTRLAVLKGDDNKDISIGPDYVIKILLATVDKYIDRFRAARRQALIIDHIEGMRRLGPFRDAANYLSNSLLAFQNIDEAGKKELSDILDDYDKKKLPADIKFLAMGFVFLNLVGESHFADVVERATRLITADGGNPTVARGSLVSVDAANKTITLRGNFPTNTTFKVDPNATITLNSTAAALAALPAGANVDIRLTADGGTAVSIQAER